MQIRIFELPPIGTNAYLLSDAESGKAVLVDAPMSAYETIAPILKDEKLELEALLLTHGHWDHMYDVAAFSERDIPIYAHPDDRKLIVEPEIQSGFTMPGMELKGAPIDHELASFETREFLGKQVEIRHVPGHCPGSVLFYFSELGCAFVGDAIFKHSVGRYDLPGGDAATLEKSIREQIFTLPETTMLCPGHGPATNVGEEMANNPFMKKGLA